ncbi:MAG: zinc ABC transporter substrate-binding protein [Chloroflexi bacterium]|nr:zinc ABC transporter substrate-binding protein [Chloroflexota bacterium]
MATRILALAVVGVLMLAGCGGSQPAPAMPAGGTTPLKVIAAESFLADIAQNVAGDRLVIDSLIPTGVDPHGFEPTPADVRKVAESDVLIVNGAGFEAFLSKLLANAGGERLVIEAAAGLASRAAREGETAVMSDTELAEALCAEASELSAAQITAGDAAAAPELNAHGAEDAGHATEEHGDEHGATLWSVTLAQQAGGRYAGFLKLDAEGGEVAIATSGGALTVTRGADQTPVGIEKTLPLDCAGLTQAAILDLESDEYLIALKDFAASQATLMMGSPGGHHHDEGDPHFWLDPARVITYVENIRDGLIAADPPGAETYRANAERYIAQLNDLDRAIAADVAQIPAADRQLVTNHESFGYYADRYGFRIIGTIVPSVSSGASPSAQQLARLTERVRATGAKAIFLETGANPQLAEQLARETGIQVISDLYTHSLSAPDGPAPTYLAMMRYNTQRIVEGLTAAQR